MNKQYFLAFARQWLRIMQDNNIKSEAAAMAFLSLLALVPTLVLMGWLIAQLPQAIANFQQVESFVLGLVVPDSAQSITESLEYLLSRSASLSIVSVPILLVSVIGLMLNLEQTLSRIFAAKPRKFIKKIAKFLIACCVGPAFLALILAASEVLPTLHALGWIDISWLLQFAPLVLEFSIFTCLYLLLPTESPGFKLSLLGGLLLTISLWCLRNILERILVELGSYELLYGIFAAVPLFFIWVYGFWMALFIVASLLHCVHTKPHNKFTNIMGEQHEQ